ncbi:MAG TPA: polysaccharide deacetylase family protein, partial [Verrucomicrobiae bacterium]|nr:polysaccharide deacetylase family protein [Verrucomicrobiae bacterium]
RPPGGSVSKSQLETLKTNGHVVTLWSLDSRDWLNQGSKRIVANVVQGAFPGAIILMHDGGDKREQTVNALENIISELRSRGYSFVTISELRLKAATTD